MRSNSRFGFLKKTYLLLLLPLFLATTAFAQTYTVKGQVTDSASHVILPGASLFIGNTTIGTVTDKDGNYEIAGLGPGKYQIVITYVGYQTKQIAFDIAVADIALNLNLKAKPTVLREVTINPKERLNNLNLFKRDFIGTTDETECKITNPDVLNFNMQNKHLVVTADDLLDIENYRLGYKLRFFISDYNANYSTGKVHYAGTVVFVNLKGTTSQEKQWAKNRADAYKGSFRHFLTSVAAGDYAKERFVVWRMIREPNTKRPPDNLINAQIARYSDKSAAGKSFDSLFKWRNLAALNRNTERLDSSPLKADDFIQSLVTPGLFNLGFDGYLYVVYTGRRIDHDVEELARAKQAKSFQIAAISIINKQRAVSFNKNGILNIKDNVFFEGAWTGRILSELPDDYFPVK